MTTTNPTTEIPAGTAGADGRPEPDGRQAATIRRTTSAISTMTPSATVHTIAGSSYQDRCNGWVTDGGRGGAGGTDVGGYDGTRDGDTGTALTGGACTAAGVPALAGGTTRATGAGCAGGRDAGRG